MPFTIARHVSVSDEPGAPASAAAGESASLSAPPDGAARLDAASRPAPAASLGRSAPRSGCVWDGAKSSSISMDVLIESSSSRFELANEEVMRVPAPRDSNESRADRTSAAKLASSPPSLDGWYVCACRAPGKGSRRASDEPCCCSSMASACYFDTYHCQ